MKKFSVDALAQIIKAEPAKNINGFFTGVSTDSRTTKPGDCFFAIRGDNFDGHDYIADAFAKGAACAVVSRDNKSADLGLLIVGDTIEALGDFAREYRRQMNFKVVAITGSVGKTTARQIASHVLSRRFRVFEAPKNFNNNIGLPLTLLGADPEDEIIVAEIAGNHPGEIAYLTRIAQPDIALITNVHPCHLEGLGNLQTIIQEKLSISQGLPPDGILIINADFDRLLDAYQANLGTQDTGHAGRVMTFGKSTASDIQAENITHTGSDSSFTINGSPVHIPLPGPGNVENAVAAWAICSRFGLTVDDFAHAVETLPVVSMRAELLKIGTLTVLNDCYNANPASMKNALDILANISSHQKCRPVFVCGDMAELGNQSRQLHIELGHLIAHAKVQLLLAVGEFARVTAEAAKTGARHDLQTICFKDTASACNNLENFIKDYDIVLVKGSRVAGLETVIEKLKELFSAAVSREAGYEIRNTK